MDDVVHFEEKDDQKLFRTESAHHGHGAAFHGHGVWHLFVQEGQQIWGTFDEMNNKVILHTVKQEGDEDLIDKAIIKTILNAGEVHLLPQDRMPGRSVVAALMRY